MNNYSQLAINANMKNTDQHIMLLGWSLDDDKSEAKLVYSVQEDKWIPRIGLQGTFKLLVILVACLARNLFCSSGKASVAFLKSIFLFLFF